MDNKKFKNPPVESRPAPFWSWNDDMTSEELTRQIDEMSEKGWGSFFMHSRVGLVTPYLQDKWFELVNACCDEAKNEGMYAHLYDEDKWPSGFAGGRVTEREEYRQRYLCLLKRSDLQDDDVVYKDLGDRVIAKRIVRLGVDWFNGYCYADLMNKEAVQYFLETTHEKYAEKCGKYMGNVIPDVFTDEPCFQMAHPGRQGAPDCDFLPWTEAFPKTFMQEKGYDILDNLTPLFYDEEGYEKIRFDFFDVALNMFIDGFTKPYAEWCEKHGVAMTGHFMAEDTLSSQTRWTSASMPHYEYMQRPGIDKLGRDVNIEQTVKQLTSVSEQLEKERNLSEVFGCMGQQASFFHRKWIAQWQAVLGIDFVNHHLSLYSMRGERKRDYPANLFYQQPWWNEERSFSDYTARMCEYVHSTVRNVDILFIHPVTTAWCLYNVHNEGAERLPYKVDLYDHGCIALTKALLAEKLDFHYGDETIMKNHAFVADGAICIGKFRYHTVVLPPILNLTSNTAKLLNKFARQGGKIICQTPCASLVDGESAEPEFIKYAKITESCGDCVKSVSKIYPDRIKIADKLSGKNVGTIYADHKHDDKYEYYFIVNNEEARSLNTVITISTSKHATVLDMSNGEEYELDTTTHNGKISLEAKLYPAGSLLIRLSDEKVDAKPASDYLGSGVEFKACEKIGEAKIDCIRRNEDNVLVLNDATLEMGGKLIATNAPLNTLWHTHFYPAKNGTPFRAEYSFEVESMPNGELTAAIEMAHNLDKITFNGKSLEIPAPNVAFDDTCYRDVNFRKVVLGTPVIGTNTIVIEGIKDNNITSPDCHVAVENYGKHKPTELEAIYVTGDFSVKTNDNITFSIVSPYAPCFKNITVSGCSFYAGSVDITCEFDASADAMPKYLRLDGVNASCVRVSVNGTDCGIAYWEPFIYDISDAAVVGKNTVTITLTTTLFNMMGPNRVDDIKNSRFIGPRIFSDYWTNFNEKYTLCDYGVNGVSLLK